MKDTEMNTKEIIREQEVEKCIRMDVQKNDNDIYDVLDMVLSLHI